VKLTLVCIFLFFNAFSSQKKVIRQGEVQLLPLSAIFQLSQEEVRVSFDGMIVPIVKYGGQKYILVAADFQKSPGLYPLRIMKGERILYETDLLVTKGIFETVKLNITYKFQDLPPAVKDSINKAKQPLLKAIKQSRSEQLWSSQFSYPLDTVEVKSNFGRIRIYKNYTAVHRGIDFRGYVGKEVFPISEGLVLWGEDTNFYLEGKLVVIDHGQGIVSMYMHLSSVDVKTGDWVTQETVIGRVGNTGHSFGPHLHLAVKVGDAFVDPVKFIKVFETYKN
jgi:murein DD-endopeptidase MepM/ murein hydrolase activator NlpD